MRIKKNYKRLASKQIFSRRLFHFSIGFAPVMVGNLKRTELKRQRKVISKFLSLARANGLSIRGFSCRDVSFKPNGLYVHYHFAVLPESPFMSLGGLFNDLISKASKGELKNVNLIGFRSRPNLLYYFAKRQAGYFGHDREDRGDGIGFTAYGYKDFMTIEQYSETFFDTRTLVILGFPEGLACNNAPDVKAICPSCGSKNLIIVGYCNEKGEETPPPDYIPRGFLVKDGKRVMRDGKPIALYILGDNPSYSE